MAWGWGEGLVKQLGFLWALAWHLSKGIRCLTQVSLEGEKWEEAKGEETAACTEEACALNNVYYGIQECRAILQPLGHFLTALATGQGTETQ